MYMDDLIQILEEEFDKAVVVKNKQALHRFTSLLVYYSRRGRLEENSEKKSDEGEA